MRMKHVAYAVLNASEGEHLKRRLGLHDRPWIQDRVTARCTVWDSQEHINTAHLQFLEVGGIELEIIYYLQGKNWLSHHFAEQFSPFVSHVAWHLDAGEPWPDINGRLAQEMWTISHTNEFLLRENRRFHSKIFEIAPKTYVKYARSIYA